MEIDKKYRECHMCGCTYRPDKNYNPVTRAADEITLLRTKIAELEKTVEHLRPYEVMVAVSAVMDGDTRLSSMLDDVAGKLQVRDEGHEILTERVSELEKFIGEECRRGHNHGMVCSAEFVSNDPCHGPCDCGADWHNVKVDAILGKDKP